MGGVQAAKRCSVDVIEGRVGPGGGPGGGGVAASGRVMRRHSVARTDGVSYLQVGFLRFCFVFNLAIFNSSAFVWEGT